MTPMSAETYPNVLAQDGDHRVVGDEEKLLFILQRGSRPARPGQFSKGHGAGQFNELDF